MLRRITDILNQLHKQLWQSGKDLSTGTDPPATAKKSATTDAENAVDGT